MSEIKFKHGTTIEGKSINDGDIIMVNDTMGSSDTNEGTDGFGSVYKGTKIVGTTKANELRLTDDLTVMGTNVGNITNGKTLEKGMTIEDILKQMLQKEVGIKTIKPTVSNFSVTPTGTVEVGELVTANFSVEYVDGKYDSADNSLWNPSELPMGAGCTPEEPKWTYNGTKVNSPHEFVAVEGENKFTYSIPYGASTVTSVKNNLGEDKSVSIPANTLSGYKTITGSYYYFCGNIAGIDETQITADNVRGLNQINGFVSNVPTSGEIGNPHVDGSSIYVIALPEGYTIVSAKFMGNPAGIENWPTKELNIVLPNNTTKKYTCWYSVNAAEAGTDYTNLVIKK